MRRLSRLAVVSLLFVTAAASAQDRPVEEAEERGGQTRTDQDRRYDDLVARFQKDYLRITTLVQVVPYVPFEDAEGREAGFDVSAAWFGIGGRLGENVGYFVRGAFEREPALLEAYVSYGSDDVRGIVGKQKAPFSAEFLTGAANIDFVNRARIVRQAVPGRSVGAALNANPGGGPVRIRAGVFNATYSGADVLNGVGVPRTQSDRGGVLVAGRATAEVPVGYATATFGANAAYDTPDTSDRFDVPGRLLLGADARLHVGRVLVAGEYIRERIDTTNPFVSDGGYATLGFDVTSDDRVLARLDVLDGDREILLGYNRTFTRAASFQLNAVVPLDDSIEPANVLANFQLAF